MTTEEQKAVEEAAKKYSASKTDGKHYRDLQCGFIAGAEFALSSLRKPSEPKTKVGEQSEELVEKITKILFEHSVESPANHGYARIYQECFRDAATEIAKLLQPDVNAELMGALKKIKTMCDGNITNENNIWHTCNKAISNYEKQQ